MIGKFGWGSRTIFCTHGSADQPAGWKALVVHSSKVQQYLCGNASSRTVMMTISIDHTLPRFAPSRALVFPRSGIAPISAIRRSHANLQRYFGLGVGEGEATP